MPPLKRIAFLVMAHNEPQLCARLIERLRSPISSIFLHVDRAANVSVFRRELGARGIHDVQWVPRVRAKWGTFGQIRASLSLLRHALRADSDAGMFVLVSGADYPLRTPFAMRAFFDQHRGVSFLSCHELPWDKWSGNGGLDRLTRWHFSGRWPIFEFQYPPEALPRLTWLRLAYRASRRVIPQSRKLPAGVSFHGGSSWWNITREAAECVCDEVERNERLVGAFRYTRCGDEIFYQTVIMNARPRLSVKSDDLRCVFWDGRRGSAYPAWISTEDFAEIRSSGNFFVRKVHPQESRALLDRIDRVLLGTAGPD